MTRVELDRKVATLRTLGLLALVGAGCAIVAFLFHGIGEMLAGLFVLALVVPFVVYSYCLVVWHWKDRYVGEHSDLWGALLIFETTGWFKLVYLFRHLLPDARRKGRYINLTT